MVQQFTVKCGEAWSLATSIGWARPLTNLKEGEVWPVSDDFIFEITPETRAAMIAKHPEWWENQERNAEFFILNNRFCLYLKANILDGDPSRLEEFEAFKGATLDKVNETTHHSDTCKGHEDGLGCIRTYLWHRDSDPETRIHHDHKVHRKCEAHSHLADEHCHAQIKHECQHKSNVLVAAHDLFGTEPHTFQYRFNENRELEISHPKLSPAAILKFQRHLRVTFPKYPVHVKEHPIHKPK